MDILGSTWCWMPALNCQSAFRTPQPSSTAGFTRVVATDAPHARLDHGPHSWLAAGLRKSHCAILSLLGSVHERVMLLTSVVAGFLIVYASPEKTPWRYFPKFAL